MAQRVKFSVEQWAWFVVRRQYNRPNPTMHTYMESTTSCQATNIFTRLQQLTAVTKISFITTQSISCNVFMAINTILFTSPCRRHWSLLNRSRTGQGHCNACRKKWGFTDNELCDCGETQTMSHIVNSCPLTKFDGGLLRLHEADEAAVNWLTTYGS